MNKLIPLALCSAATAAPAGVAQLEVTVQIPRLHVAEYHQPYLAVWLESPDRSRLQNLAVWYDVNLKNNEGTEWLKDLRQWWRRLGRELQMPADGVSGATRAPGEHTLTFTAGHPALLDLPPGEYRLIVEAAREVGGRELLEVTFQWPADQVRQLRAQGSRELGAINVRINP